MTAPTIGELIAGFALFGGWSALPWIAFGMGM